MQPTNPENQSSDTDQPQEFCDDALANANAKIVMIDDEPLILELYEVYLSQAGYRELHSFSDSVEAIELLKFVTPDLILTDLQMPEVSGNFMIKLIRTYRHLQNVPIIAITSDTSEGIRDDIMKRGANAVVHKPINAEKLLEFVTLGLKANEEVKNNQEKAERQKQEVYQRRKANAISAENNLRNLVR